MEPIAIGLVVSLCALVIACVVTLAVLSRYRRLKGAASSPAGAYQLLETFDNELRHLVSVRMPEIAAWLANGRPVPERELTGLLHPRLQTTAFEQIINQVIGAMTAAVDTSQRHSEQTAKASLKALMRAVQNLANEQQAALSRMQEATQDPDVLEGLMRLDHLNSQLARKAQATAVICGAWPGLQRDNSTLTDVVRGATSRIRDYRRVSVPVEAETAVVSRAVEPVVLAVAELLDNATRHSRPGTKVEVNFTTGHNGTAIMVDDAGIGMGHEELAAATATLTTPDPVDINTLGDPPQMGFAVVGQLAARYGFTVSVDTRSPYGGVRAVVFLPARLLTRVSNHLTLQPETLDAPPPPTASVGAPAQTTAGGLPRRRRRDLADSASPPLQPPAAVDTSSADGSTPSVLTLNPTALAAWKRGTDNGRSATQPTPRKDGT